MRFPAVAGSFYPGGAPVLQRTVDELLAKAKKEVKPLPSCRAIVVPHAGYVYSGLTAAYSFAAVEPQLKRPDTTAIIIGPNHTGLGNPISVSFEDWKTPIGTTSTDLPLAGAIIKSNPIITKNEAAHLMEHSIEVQLPFLQTINPKAKLVAICMGRQDEPTAKMIGESIASVLSSSQFSKRNILLIASSDFTHYETGESARAHDAQPLEFIKALEADEFEREVEASNLSICGHGPIAAVLHASKLLGAKKAQLLRYTNSGKETNGNESQVVAYASFAIA